MGVSLQKSVESYNALVGALESRVLVTARKMHEIGLANTPLPENRPLETAPRPLTATELIAALDSDVARPEFDLDQLRATSDAAARHRSA
jgi:DNA recombination protein RmuC